MHIHTAIEILEMTISTDEVINFLDYMMAVRLGLQALQRIEACRLADHTIREDYLPEETIVYHPVRKP